MAVISPSPLFQFIDSDGTPLFGGKVYTYEAGTTTPKTTFTDAGGVTPNSNPILLDEFGVAAIWLGDGGYKFTITTSSDALIRTIDNIEGDLATQGPFLTSNNGSATNVQHGRSASVGLFYPNGTQVSIATAGQERFRMTATGRQLTTAAASIEAYAVNDGAFLPLVNVVNDATIDPTAMGEVITTFSTSAAFGGTLTLAHANANIANTFTTIGASGFTLGQVRFDGSDGTDFSTGAMIRGITNAAATAGNVPADLVFYTKTSGGSLTEKLRLTGDGRLYGTALHNNAGSLTGATNQYVASGSATTFNVLNGANVASSTPGYLRWTRVGNVVTVTGNISITATMGATSTVITFVPPIASSFTNAQQASGWLGPIGAAVVVDLGLDWVQFTFTSAGTSATTYNFGYQYEVFN